MSKKKMLVIGGTGFIGFHLCKFFLKKDIQIFSLSLAKPKKIRSLKNVTYLRADISKKKNLNILKKYNFKYVINCGGYVDHFNKVKTYNSHYKGLKNLVEILRRKEISTFVQIGSGNEYGRVSSPHKEIFKCKPKSVYARSKLLATNFLLKEFKTNFFPSVILRLYQVYGPYQDNNRFISFIINSCIKNNKFPCSEGTQLRDFLYVDDVVNAVSKCIDNKKAYGKIINIGYGKTNQLRQIILKIRNYINKGHPNFGEIKMRKDEEISIFPKITKAKKILKWKPLISFKKGLQKTINFYKRNNLVY